MQKHRSGGKKEGKKAQWGVTDVQGDRSQRRGAVANFMPCIFLSCLANSQCGAGPMKHTSSSVHFYSPPPSRQGGLWSGGVQINRGGLTNPYYGLLSYRANSHLIKTKKEGRQ